MSTAHQSELREMEKAAEEGAIAAGWARVWAG